jgi:16S rRNA processing protein RimM
LKHDIFDPPIVSGDFLITTMEEYRILGKFVATHGVQGELVLKHELGKKSVLKGLTVLFIEMKKDDLLPYFIESVKLKNEVELYVKLEGIETPEAGRPLTRKTVWLPTEQFLSYASSSAPSTMVGFHIINNGEDIGEVLEVIEQPHQLLCRLDIAGKEALIPVHEATLSRIDKRLKKIFVSLPDGLLEIYQ